MKTLYVVMLKTPGRDWRPTEGRFEDHEAAVAAARIYREASPEIQTQILTVAPSDRKKGRKHG